MSSKNRNTYTLRVCFDSKQYLLLRDAGYKVCISKQVNGKYNVVWSSQGVSSENIFHWTEEYGVFVPYPSTNGVIIDHRNETTEIAFGQTVTLWSYGCGPSRASGPLVGCSFSVLNKQYNDLAVSQKISGAYQVIHFDHPTTGLPAINKAFVPSSTIIVFLSTGLNSSCTILETDSVTIPVSFAGKIEQTVSYIADPSSPDHLSGIWISGTRVSPGTFATTGKGSQALSSAVVAGKLSAMTPQQYSVERGFESMPHGTDAFKVTELINFFINEFEPAEELSNQEQ